MHYHVQTHAGYFRMRGALEKSRKKEGLRKYIDFQIHPKAKTEKNKYRNIQTAIFNNYIFSKL